MEQELSSLQQELEQLDAFLLKKFNLPSDNLQLPTPNVFQSQNEKNSTEENFLDIVCLSDNRKTNLECARGKNCVETQKNNMLQNETIENEFNSNADPAPIIQWKPEFKQKFQVPTPPDTQPASKFEKIKFQREEISDELRRIFANNNNNGILKDLDCLTDFQNSLKDIESRKEIQPKINFSVTKSVENNNHLNDSNLNMKNEGNTVF